MAERERPGAVAREGEAEPEVFVRAVEAGDEGRARWIDEEIPRGETGSEGEASRAT